MKDKMKLELLRIINEYMKRNATHCDDEEESSGGSKGGHGNTRIPFGLCKEFGIQTGNDWTPRDAWEALEESSVTGPEEVWETLQENKNLSKWKGEYRGSAERNLKPDDLGSLMPKGKTKKTVAEKTMDSYIEECNKRYSVRGNNHPSAIFTAIGKLQKDTGTPGYLQIGNLEHGLDYYSPEKHRVAIPAYLPNRQNHNFLAGTTRSLGSYIDYLCGDGEKPYSLKDEGIQKAIADYSGKKLTVNDIPWIARSLKDLTDHQNKVMVNAKKKEEESLLKKELADEWDKYTKGKIGDYAYYSKEFDLVNNDDRFKHIKDVDERIERTNTYRQSVTNFLKALSDTMPPEDNERYAPQKEIRSNGLISEYLTLAQIEPRALGYLHKELPEVIDAISDCVYNMAEKAGVDWSRPDYTLEKYQPLPDDSEGDAA